MADYIEKKSKFFALAKKFHFQGGGKESSLIFSLKAVDCLKIQQYFSLKPAISPSEKYLERQNLSKKNMLSLLKNEYIFITTLSNISLPKQFAGQETLLGVNHTGLDASLPPPKVSL